MRLRFLVLVTAISALVIGCGGSGDTKHGVNVTIGGVPLAKPIPAGFTGFSIEYSAVPAYTGKDPRAINPVLTQLIRNLNPGQAPELRIGGDSTDRTWWPVPGMALPHGIRYSLSGRWTSVVRALAQSLGAHLVLGVNMEANSRSLSAYEARTLVTQIGARSISALELGNEPELYGAFPLYQRNGVGIRGRPSSYAPPDFTREFSRTALSMPKLPLAGPATGAPQWEAYLPQFAAAQPRLALLTVHLYATRGCFTTPLSPQYHTITNLLSIRATRGLADSVAPYVRLRPVRIDELGSVNCGGVHGVSDTFASALWSLDTLFQLARVGVSGVNFHTFPGARYQPFAFTHRGGAWRASVKPEYYGLLMFAQAALPGSRLLAGSGQIRPGVDAWALRGPDGHTRVVAINYAGAGATTLALHLPGDAPAATVERLQAPGLTAKTGVTIGGSSFPAQTGTGKLTDAPNLSTLQPTNGAYVLRVPQASAVLLTL